MKNVAPNADFAVVSSDGLPEGWTLKSPRPSLAPVFRATKKGGRPALLASGNGREDCVGHLWAPVRLQRGRTYVLRTRFRVSRGVSPQTNLLFCFYAQEPQFNNGIFRYKRLRGGWIEGEGRFLVSGKGEVSGQVRIYFRQSAAGKAWIDRIEMAECDPIPPRLVTFACTNGQTDLKGWARVLDAAAKAEADLALLPELMNGEAREPLRGPSARLMAQKAKQHRMYVAGGFYCYDRKRDRLLNTALLFDRQGRQAGRYTKNHPYSPEVLDLGVTAGTEVPVFRTDFGTVGVLICYDSWFTDVAELLALKGAEVILFPNAGYYRSLMPARSTDNCVRFVVSSLGSGHGIWDTTGTEVTDPNPPPTCHPNHPTTYRNVRRRKIGKIEMLVATLDLSQSPSPHNWGGPMLSAPGGRRNRREQSRLLYEHIQREIERWWEE
jgi:predicted amidohydrolase